MSDIKIDFPAIQTRLKDAEIASVAQAIHDAKTLTMGPYLKEFEDNFARYIGTSHAFGVNNCTAALELAAILSGVGEGDEVILPAHTFTATALPFLRRKAKLVFADIDPETLVMDVVAARAKVTPRTRVIVPVHLYGLPVQMDALMDLAQEHDLFVVEDCAQSPGAEFSGKKVGSFGDLGCFSFHGQKNITTLGEGGMVVTDNNGFREKILGLRKIGARPFAHQEKYWKPAMSNIVEAIPGELPYNFALPEISAFAGNLILKRIDGINAGRRAAMRRIVAGLKGFPELVFQTIPQNCKSACHLLPARYDGSKFGKHRDDLIEELCSKHGIKCVVQYYPLYRYELFQKNGYGERTCPKSDDFFDSMLSFPFWSDMSDSDIECIIGSTRAALERLRGR